MARIRHPTLPWLPSKKLFSSEIRKKEICFEFSCRSGVGFRGVAVDVNVKLHFFLFPVFAVLFRRRRVPVFFPQLPKLILEAPPAAVPRDADAGAGGSEWPWPWP